MSERLAVEVEHVSKRYAVGDQRGLLRRPFARTHGNSTRETLWALHDVNLQLAPGESVGLIGHNGAGKTTLLRLLAGITRPTAGRVCTSGRVASLINLGAGFHPELTGRENIELNGVILGLSRQEVRARFDAIVEFADLDAYIDTPLKRYSSGMVARLGFAVAAHVDPDVLLVDEVLSVGDVGFQDRSIRKMLSFRDSGQAILFVSHNLSAVEMMCQRTIWLDHGVVRQSGPTAEVVRAYLDAVDEGLIGGAAEAQRGSVAAQVGLEQGSATVGEALALGSDASAGAKGGGNSAAHQVAGAEGSALGIAADWGGGEPAATEGASTSAPPGAEQSGDLTAPIGAGGAWATEPGAESDTMQIVETDTAADVVVVDLRVLDGMGRACSDFDFGDPLRAKVRCVARRPIERVQCTLTVRGDYGPLFAGTSDVLATWSRGPHEIECEFARLPLLPGLYRLEAEISYAGGPGWGVPRFMAAFRVVTDLAEYGSDSVVGTTKSRGGFLAVAYAWRVTSAAGEQHLAGLRLPDRGSECAAEDQ